MLLWLLPETAAAQTETVEYYATDAIGSIRVVFDASGNVLGRMDYAPFGEELYQGLFLPSQRFAQLTRDGEAGQDYAEARMYRPRTGAFTSADSVYAGLFNPSAWNRYAYGLNNPMRFTDPSGLCPECPRFDTSVDVIGSYSFIMLYWKVAGLATGGGVVRTPGSRPAGESGAGRGGSGSRGGSTTGIQTNTNTNGPEPCTTSNSGADGLTQLIPIVGPAQSAIRNFEAGSWGWGLLDSMMAATDVVLAKAAAAGILRGAVKYSGSHTSGATRSWYRRSRGIPTGSPEVVHHWAIQDQGPIGRYVPDIIKNQPINFNVLPSRQFHLSVHGQGIDPFGPLGRLWYGSPGWAKAAVVSGPGRALDSGCQ
jgi:RHS repeat-associated protein